MLDDVDRTMQYSEAIRQCVNEVPVSNPYIVDVGVGTGLLSALALFHNSSAIVVGVDVNERALRASRKVMQDLGFSNRFYGVTVSANMNSAALLKKIQRSIHSTDSTPFDVILSEILGTFVYGESMETYVSKYLPFVKTFDDKLYAIPQKCTQTFASYEFQVPISSKHAIESALYDALRYKEYISTDKGGLGIALHMYASKQTNAPVPIYEATYTKKPISKQTVRQTIQMPTLENTEHLNLGVFEWECDLWNGTMLKNTIKQYKEISQTTSERYALARQNAWGFMVCGLKQVSHVKVKYTKEHCTEISLTIDALPYILHDVAMDRFSWVATSADENLATNLCELVKHNVRDHASTVIHIVDDVTCGLFTHKLSMTLQNVAIDVSTLYSSVHDVVEKVCESTRANLLKMRGMRRRLKEIRTPSCVICPSLCYMHSDYERKKQQYLEFAKSLGCDVLFPSCNSIRETVQVQTSSGPMISHPQFPRKATAIPQMIEHDETRFSTRDFHSVPFWNLDDSSEQKFDLTVHHVQGDGPIANLSRIEQLLVQKDYASALARMVGGSGIICRIGYTDVPTSSEEDDDDDDDDEEYRPTKRRR